MGKKKTVFTYSASNKFNQHLSNSGLTAGRVGLARFFSSCFLGTFSGRWRGDPSDLEEALREQKEAELVRGDRIGQGVSALKRSSTACIKTAENVECEQTAQHSNEQDWCCYSNNNVLISG